MVLHCTHLNVYTCPGRWCLTCISWHSVNRLSCVMQGYQNSTQNQSNLTRSFLTVICLKQMNENWFCACIDIFFTSFIFQTQFSSLLRILWIPSLIIEDWPIPETKDIDSRTKAITRANKVTQLQAGRCDKMSVRSSPGTGFLVTQLSPRGATKWWGIILIRGEVPVNYTS